MSKSGNWYIAFRYGADHTLYAAMRAMGIPLTPGQERCQAALEKMYPERGGESEEKLSSPKDN